MPDLILVALRSESTGVLCTTALQTAGFRIIHAATVADALTSASEHRPVVLVLDTQLPDLDVDSWQRLTQLSRAQLSIIHVWGESTSAADWSRGLEADGASYLVEPIDPRLLVGQVRAAVRCSTAQFAARRAKKRVQRDWIASERRYRSVVEKAPFGICRCATDGTILWANAAVAAIVLEANRTALIGGNIRDLFDEPAVGEELLRRWRDERSLIGHETRWVRSNGDVADVVLSATDVVEDRGATRHVFVDDVTGRRRLEEEFRHAQKMEAVGRLAGGIAHDFNNLLTAILGYCEIVGDDLGSHHQSAPDLRQIREATHMAAALTRQLLAFSRRQMLQLETLQLDHIVATLEPMLRRLIGEQIELVVTRGEDVPPIHGDTAQLQQVVMNLVVNARDAMPSGGRITIGCERDNEHVQLTITDTGTGISDEVRPHLFEPFFTTKEKGRGTGLGLATVYGIVTQLGGSIDVQSGLGRGTTFRILLPVESCVLWRMSPTTAPDARPACGSETVLLVEDEESVRTLAQRVLLRHGYRVIHASSPKAAVDIAAIQNHPIDLVLTDVIMPGMGVREMVARIRADAPATPVLYMSGYASDAIVHEGIVDADVQLLFKPFSPEQMLRRVRETLDAHRVSADPTLTRAVSAPPI